MTGYVCEVMNRHHDRDSFDCGVPLLNHYLSHVASQDIRRKAAAVYVMVSEDQPKRIVGFYTLSATSIELSALPADIIKKLPRYPEIPAILIGRLARDLKYPGVGSLLLADALIRSARVAREIAASFVVVDSKSDAATRFYEKFGFLSLPRLPQRMFLPMSVAESF